MPRCRFCESIPVAVLYPPEEITLFFGRGPDKSIQDQQRETDAQQRACFRELRRTPANVGRVKHCRAPKIVQPESTPRPHGRVLEIKKGIEKYESRTRSTRNTSETSQKRHKKRLPEPARTKSRNRQTEGKRQAARPCYCTIKDSRAESRTFYT